MPRLYGMTLFELQDLNQVTYSSCVLRKIRDFAGSKKEVCARLLGNLSASSVQIKALEICVGYSSNNSFQIETGDSGIDIPDGMRFLGLLHTHPGCCARISRLDTYYASLSPFFWAIVGCERKKYVIRHYIPNFGGVREIIGVKNLAKLPM